MTKMILSNKDFQKMPYSSTTVAWTKTKGEIEGLLYELRSKGILKKHGWVTEGDADDEVDTLYMELEIPISDAQLRTINLKFQPTMIYREKKNRQRQRVMNCMKDTSWRVFYWHFKSKMEAVKYGLVTLENEFMSNIMHYLEDGSEATFGEALKMILLEDKVGSLLEHKNETKSNAKIIEAEVVEHN